MDTILAEHAPEVGEVDAVCVDVEGWELTVLSGFNLAKFKPAVVILENIFRKPEYTDYMAEHGYAMWLGLGLNEVYIRADLQSPYYLAAAQMFRAKYHIVAMKNRITKALSKRISVQ